MKAPTGFGKTVVIYKIINELKPCNILILTPRKNLNKQFIEEKYRKHLDDINYNCYIYNLDSNNKNKFEKISTNKYNITLHAFVKLKSDKNVIFSYFIS